MPWWPIPVRDANHLRSERRGVLPGDRRTELRHVEPHGLVCLVEGSRPRNPGAGADCVARAATSGERHLPQEPAAKVSEPALRQKRSSACRSAPREPPPAQPKCLGRVRPHARAGGRARQSASEEESAPDAPTRWSAPARGTVPPTTRPRKRRGRRRRQPAAAGHAPTDGHAAEHGPGRKSHPWAKPDKASRKTHRQLRGKRRGTRRLHPWANNQGHTLRAKGKLAATSRDWKTVLTNSQDICGKL